MFPCRRLRGYCQSAVFYFQRDAFIGRDEICLSARAFVTPEREILGTVSDSKHNPVEVETFLKDVI
jgi:hypothetical protein